jgi:hypothetical protein
MPQKGNPYPLVQESTIYRSHDPIQLFDKFLVVNTTEQISDSVECGAFRKFGIFVRLDSTGAPTTIQVKVQFLNRWDGEWYTYKQGPFAALFWEDGDTATAQKESFVGECFGRAIRVTLTGVGTTSIAYFAASITLELYQ